MTSAGFRVALYSFSHRAPFRPYLLEFVSGERIRITHPEAVALRRNLAYYVATNKANRLFDHESVCQLLDEPAQPLAS